MKRKVLICLFAAVTATAIAGGIAAYNTYNTSKAASNEKITGVETETVEASTEYNELTVKTDWDEMATISIDGDSISISGSGCTESDGVITITDGGLYTITGSSDDCQIVVNSEENVKIVLNGVTLTNDDGPVIYGAQVKNLYIEMAEGTTNTLTDGTAYAVDDAGEDIGKAVISCEDDLIILGDGELIINSNYKHGIASDDKLYIESGTITITSAVVDGIHANDLVCMDGGTIDITATSDIMESEDMLVVNGGTINGTSSDEGLEAKGNLYINGGYIDIATEDDGLNAGTAIEINDGTLYITATVGDAIDANGNYDGCITINGGLVYAMGGSNPEGGIDADMASAYINGGTVIIIGDVNSLISESSEAISLVYGSFSAGETIGILDADGNTVFAIEPTVAGTTMIISTPEIQAGETYTIYTGGTISGNSDAYGYYSDGEYSGGTSVMEVTADSQVVEAGGSASGMNGMMGGQGGLGQMDGQTGEMPSDGKSSSDGQMPQMNGKGGPGGNMGAPGEMDNQSSSQ